MTETATVLGVRIQGSFECAGCGVRITPAELEWLVRTYCCMARCCAFCGKPIRLLSVSGLRHHHDVSEKRETCWDFEGWAEEEHFSWMTHRRDWSLEMDAHLACAKAACPYADWACDGSHALSADGRSVTTLVIESPCPRCGAVITPEAQDKALRWLFDIHDKPCVFCGEGFALHTAQIVHHHLFKDQECKMWSIPDWKAEEYVDWCAHVQLGSGLRSIDMRSHFTCARRAMPHAVWTPPLPRDPWKKQDWSCRIEPWFRGIIKGEAVPDWGRMMGREETRRLWREA